MVSGYPVDTRFSQSGASENVSATDYNSYFDIRPGDFPDFDSNPVNDVRIDAVVFLTQQSFAAELQEDSFIGLFSHQLPVA
jgi:hypothetical protein